jgi:hypothetical protein
MVIAYSRNFRIEEVDDTSTKQRIRLGGSARSGELLPFNKVRNRLGDELDVCRVRRLHTDGTAQDHTDHNKRANMARRHRGELCHADKGQHTTDQRLRLPEKSRTPGRECCF